MQAVALLALTLLSVASADLIGRDDGYELFDFSRLLHSEWRNFKSTYGRVYRSGEEESRRLKVFEQNLKYIQHHNMLADIGVKSYRLGVNDFADLTHEEFLRQRTGLRQPASHFRRGIAFMPAATRQNLPREVDWRQKGAVTPVKDQGQCGSCWSFSTTGSLEGQHFRKTGRLVSLSEQQLVDCSGSFGNMGCNGGLMDSAFKYIRQYGIESESTYPYKAREGSCRYTRRSVVANCTGFVDVPEGSEAKLKEAVANVGPVSVAIDASHPSFQMYSEGVYDEPDCSAVELDHGVLVVGYGTSETGQDYWLVKNSWNVQWGDRGYIKMSRNRGNQCGIASSASYPTV